MPLSKKPKVIQKCVGENLKNVKIYFQLACIFLYVRLALALENENVRVFILHQFD